MAAFNGYRVKDRTAKLAKKRDAMKVNGQSMKRLLVDRAANAQLGSSKDLRVLAKHGGMT